MGLANSAGPGEPDLSPPSEADPAELRRRIEAGEWVVDLRSADGVRGRARHGTRELRPGRAVRHLPRLAAALGHPDHPARRDGRGRRRGPARTGPHRHRPPGRHGHRQARGLGRRRAAARASRTATFADLAAELAQDPQRPSSSTSAATRSAPSGYIAGLRAHPDPRGARPPRRDPAPAGLGALRRRLPRRRRGRPARRPRPRRRGRSTTRSTTPALPVFPSPPPTRPLRRSPHDPAPPSDAPSLEGTLRSPRRHRRPAPDRRPHARPSSRPGTSPARSTCRWTRCSRTSSTTSARPCTVRTSSWSAAPGSGRVRPTRR